MEASKAIEYLQQLDQLIAKIPMPRPDHVTAQNMVGELMGHFRATAAPLQPDRSTDAG